jgi:hypothetical protein
MFRFSLAASVAWVLAASVLVASASVLLAWLAAGRPTVRQVDSVSLGAAADALKFAGGMVLGVGGAVALVVAYRRQRLGEAEHQRQDEASDRDRTRLFNERFARASDQLGSERPAIRLAGIYAMAGLADDWEDGRQACIDVLCAYLRMPFRPRDVLPEYERSPHQRLRSWEAILAATPEAEPGMDSVGEAQVRSSVIQVLRDRLWSGARVSWHGAYLDFTGAVLEDASFDGMDFTDCTVKFDDCLFTGECGFSETTWRRTDASFLGALFAGRLGFEYSTFEESDVTLYGDFTERTDANFQGVTLKSGSLRLLGPRENGGSVSFVGAELSGGELELHASTLREGSSIAFSRAILSGTKVKIEGGEHKAGNIWCNGVDVRGGSFTVGAVQWAREPVRLEGVEFSFDGARITDGEVALRGVMIAGSDVHFDDLEMSGGRLDLSECGLTSGALRFSNATISGGQVAIADPSADGLMSAAARTLKSAGARIVDEPNAGTHTP